MRLISDDKSTQSEFKIRNKQKVTAAVQQTGEESKHKAERSIKESVMVPGHPRGVVRERWGCRWGAGQLVWSKKWIYLPDKPGRMCEIPTGVTSSISASVSGSKAMMERLAAVKVQMDRRREAIDPTHILK